ncbi:hypothetical protein GVX81_10975 [[Haemophilus] felis]|uniref:Uncharacterized protein n=2 Tax=Pasteurellaceae TaxID=712 RepID=A0A1T0B5N4_9PAST|nr:Imm8 family immunity protein [Canicola haemoglobinophilus]NBI14101.1 hypothetical protein [[Haemophilus] felis]NBI41824.1 hypothetical protein [[Haemophilus] felis]NBI43906.1 hypothetical protein [[Haemophilus] felis]OOR97086.1 hypothetical protein B0186_10845 [Canicola haemoglobinophilus]OOS05091.1 hypothetical protein B0188_04595 [[Haemophilus] felis]
MITAELKNFEFYGSVIDKNDAQLLMLSPEYRLTLCLSIGETGKIGADYFYVDVINVAYVKSSRLTMGSKSFIATDDIDNIDDIENEIRVFVNSIYGKSWEDVLVQLRRYFDWEYENHKLVE